MKVKSNTTKFFFCLLIGMFIAIPFHIYPQSKSDSTKIKGKFDTTKQIENRISSDTNKNQNDQNAKKSNQEQMDSTVSIKTKELIESKEKEIKKLIESKEKEDGEVLLYIFIIFAVFFLIINAVLFYYISKKIKHLNGRIDKHKMDFKNFDNLNSIGASFKNDFQSLSRNFSNLESGFKEMETKIQELKTKLEEITIKINAENELNTSLQTEQSIKEIEVNKLIEDKIEEDVGKYYNVEYFVEGGVIKFRETDSGSPFYMQQFKNRSELSLDEKAFATTYSESIEKCFNVKGNKSGNYKNINPGKCEFDSYLSIWKLLEKGDVEGK